MPLGNLATFKRTESKVKRITITSHKEDIFLIERLIDVYIDGFRLVDSVPIIDRSQLDHAWILLTARSFNSMRCAYELIKLGYYSQAVTLARSVYEDWLICQDCQTSRDTLDAVLSGKGKLRQNDLRYSAMAKRISKRFHDDIWKPNYGVQSEFAHAHAHSLNLLLDSETNMVRFGSHYDQKGLIFACQNLIMLAIIMTEFLQKVLGSDGNSWEKEALPIIREAHEWLESTGSGVVNQT
ncbi:MAG: hypothetical protein U9N44_04915 [Chloroflexota bacterium]|nr:hypothetical protein [Chloroflexota bacterium]